MEKIFKGNNLWKYISLSVSLVLCASFAFAESCSTVGATQNKYTASGCSYTTQTRTCCSDKTWSAWGGSCSCSGSAPASWEPCSTDCYVRRRTVSCDTSTGTWIKGNWGNCEQVCTIEHKTVQGIYTYNQQCSEIVGGALVECDNALMSLVQGISGYSCDNATDARSRCMQGLQGFNKCVTQDVQIGGLFGYSSVTVGSKCRCDGEYTIYTCK